MMLHRVFSYFLAVCQGVALAAELVPRATFSQVTNFGANPTNTRMFLFVPQNLAPKPAIVVGLHWCTGSAQAYYQGSNWARLSETYGYIVIYPSTPYLDSNCWDVASQKALTRGGGGNSDSIANMVKHVTEQYGADASRVYVTGISSGAMMTVGTLEVKLNL
jgi:acetylxylan esterase